MKNITQIAQKMLTWINKADIWTLTFFPSLISVLLVLGLGWGSKLIPANIEKNWILGICFVPITFIFSLGGLAQIYRKEMPGPFGKTVKGWWPVVSGLFLIIMCWALILWIIWGLMVAWRG